MEAKVMQDHCLLAHPLACSGIQEACMLPSTVLAHLLSDGAIYGRLGPPTPIISQRQLLTDMPTEGSDENNYSNETCFR